MSLSEMAKSVFAVLCMLVLLTGCQTPQYKSFEGARLGMDKHSVLEAAGKPRTTSRWKGKDRWTYDFVNTPDGPQTREIHFENGRAVYIGGKVVPPVTAAEQDKINEESNVQEAKRLDDNRIRYEKAMGTVRVNRDLGENVQSYGPSANTEVIADVQEQLTGIPNPEREKRKRAPMFVPLD
jgi:outer membrane protein assembly factor BamE (lipoprotein component of BamABCDE complex)